MFRSLLAVAILTLAFTTLPTTVEAGMFGGCRGGGWAQVQAYIERERRIKQMPLLQRPDRPGHFFGNTVRRIYRQHR